MRADLILEAVECNNRLLASYNPQDALRLNQAWAELKAPYAHLYGERHLGDAVGPGWWGIVRNAFSQIDVALKTHPGSSWRVQQIKEKFGGLRIYGVATGDDFFLEEVNIIVDRAESAAVQTCEWCGMPGIPRETGWIKTLCDVHAAHHEERQRSRFKT